jgi:hypothetical protein
MLYIILRGHWCDVIVPNIQAPTEDKIDDVKASFYKELQWKFNTFPNTIQQFYYEIMDNGVESSKLCSILKSHCQKYNIPT